MAVIEVAAGIPCPQTSTVTPEERRLLSEGSYGPRSARTIELDERQFQTLTWALSAVQAAVFRDWYRVTLIYGGAWFSAPATWPTPEGLVVKVRRFIGDPQWTYRGNGHWLLAINAEVRGETLLPSEPIGDFFLDTFTGTFGDLSDHAPDVAPTGFAWLLGGSGFGLKIDGSGNAFISGFGSSNSSNDSPSAFDAMVLGAAWRIEMDARATGGTAEGGPDATFVCRTDNDPSGVAIVFQSGDAGTVVVSVSTAEVTLLSGALSDAASYTARIDVTASSISLSINGTLVDTAATDMSLYAAFVGANLSMSGNSGDASVSRVAVYPAGTF